MTQTASGIEDGSLINPKAVRGFLCTANQLEQLMKELREMCSSGASETP
jgi:hypothetical protein